MVSLSSYADIGGMAQSLQQSIDAAVKRVQQQAAGNGGATGKVQEYEQTVNKSALNAAPFATNIGTLVKDTSRLNVFSSLAANDPADFYKFTVTTSGAPTLGTVGDAGVRLQLMDRGGKDVPIKEAKNYGVQLRMGDYSKDYDTIAKQPAKGDNPFGNNTKLQGLAAILGAGSTSLTPASMILGGTAGSYGGRGSLLNALL